MLNNVDCVCDFCDYCFFCDVERFGALKYMYVCVRVCVCESMSFFLIVFIGSFN